MRDRDTFFAFSILNDWTKMSSYFALLIRVQQSNNSAVEKIQQKYFTTIIVFKPEDLWYQ